MKKTLLQVAVVLISLGGCSIRAPKNPPANLKFSPVVVTEGSFEWSVKQDPAPNPNPRTICLKIAAKYKGAPVEMYQALPCGRISFRRTQPYPQILGQVEVGREYFSILLFIPKSLTVTVDGETLIKNGYISVVNGPITGRPVEFVFNHGRCETIPGFHFRACELMSDKARP
jgi:hypothetical protein